MAVKRNWAALKTYFAHHPDHITLRQFSVEKGIPLSTVERHSDEDHWFDERAVYDSAVATEMRTLGANKEAKKRLDILDSAYNIAETLKETIDKIAQRVSSEGFDGDVDSMQANSLLERLSSLSTSFERLARAINLLEGGVDSRVQVTLAEILGASASSR